jgi:hypothetical protein
VGDLLDGLRAEARCTAARHLDEASARRKLAAEQIAAGKKLLVRVVSMLTRMLDRFSRTSTSTIESG